MNKLFFALVLSSSFFLTKAQNYKTPLEKVIGEKTLPSVTLADMNGKNVNVADYGKSGKITVLSFWATWCSPCLKTIPQKNALIGEYRNKPIKFINISFDKEKEIWEKSVKDHSVLGLNLICIGNWVDILKTKYYIQGNINIIFKEI